MRLIALALCGLLCACSTSDENAAVDGGPDASVYDNDAGVCDMYIDLQVGDPCSVSPALVCFRQCKTDGCTCQNSKWACTKDFSCVPEGGPLDDSDSGADDDDATVPVMDAGQEAGVDAGQDAGVDAAIDSPADSMADAMDASDAMDGSDGSDGAADAGADG